MELKELKDEFMKMSSADLVRCQRSIESMIEWRKLVIDAAEFAEEDFDLWTEKCIPMDMPGVVALNIWQVSHEPEINSYIKLWEGK